MGIIDTDQYRTLVESLDKLGVLKREITSVQAQRLSKTKKVSRKCIGRYRIVIPDSENNTIQLSGSTDDSDYAKVFIRNLNWYANEDDIEEALSRFGEISEIVIPKNKFTGSSRGFAFIEFEKKEAAKKAVEYKQSILIKGRKIYIQNYRE